MINKNKRIEYLMVFGAFVFGALSFFLFHVRIGYHPYALRIVGARRSLENVTSFCSTGNDNNRTKFMICAQKRLIGEVARWGLRPLMDALEVKQLEQTGENQAITQCHDLTHAIGAAGLIVMKDLNSTLLSCTNTCVYGCQHGVISAWYSMGKDIVQKLPGICVDGLDWTKLPFGQNGCFHEIGHAVANIAGYNMEKALQYCDKVSPVGKVDCGHGVFMEAYEPATFTDSPIPLPPNYVEWCGTLWDPYKQICYDKAGANIYGRTQNDELSFATCAKVPLESRSGCITALGQNIFYVYQHELNQAKKILSFCRIAQNLASYCIHGALSSSSVSQPNVSGGIAVCNELSGDEHRDCVLQLTDTISTTHTAIEKDKICLGFRTEDIPICTKGK